MSTIKGFKVGNETVQYQDPNLTSEFSSSKTYAVGDYCFNDGQLYRCTTAITTTGTSWDDSKWAAAKLANDTNDLKNAFNLIQNIEDNFIDLSEVEMTVGSYIKADGTIGTSEAFQYSDYIEIPMGTLSITVNRVVWLPTDRRAYPQNNMVFFYNDSYEYLGTGNDPMRTDALLTITPYPTAKYIRVNFPVIVLPPFVKISRSVIQSSRTIIYNLGISDLNDCIPNYIYARTSNTHETANLPYGGWLGTLIAVSFTGNFAPGIVQLAFSSTNRFHYRRSWGSNNNWGSWTEFLSENNVNEALGFVGKYEGAFTALKQQIDTGIILEPNKEYLIRFYNERQETINVYGAGNSETYKNVRSQFNSTRFLNDGTTRNLIIYNPSGSILDSVVLKVFEVDSPIEKTDAAPILYRVSKNATDASVFDYTSITQCFLDLKDDERPKIIEIWEGDYDIYQEYIDANVPVYTGDNPSMEYFDYCVWVPKNTHVIGRGIVRLKWMPDPATDPITAVQCRCVSPLNVAASCTIENIELHCKNGRYCLHNDGLGYAQFRGAVQIYKNMRCYKYGNDTEVSSGLAYGFSATTGFGIDRSQHHVYENCTFVNYAGSRAFYGHTRATTYENENQSPDITLANCVIDANSGNIAIKFGNSQNRNAHLRVMFNNCYISAKVLSGKEGSETETCANAYDIQYLNCGNVSMQINDPDNPYPPKAYNTTLTIIT